MPEINDLIIDHASDDKATLVACALVSRSFHSRSAMHLFDSVTIVNDDTLLDFHRGAQSSFCRAYVKELTLGRPKLRRHRPHCDCPPPLRVDGEVIFDLIAALPSLRPENVTIEDVFWKPVRLRHRLPLTTTAASPNQLYVMSPATAPCNDMSTIFLAVGPVASEVGKEAKGVCILEVKAVQLLIDPASRNVSGEGEAAASNIVDVVVYVGDLNSLHIPSISGPKDVVNSLAICWKTNINLSLFNGTFPCLCHVEALLNGATSAIECGQKLSLSSYRKLHSVNLWVTLHLRAPPAWQQWQAYLALLLQVPGNQVSKVTVGIILDSDDFDLGAMRQVKTTRWGMLSSILPHVPGLRCVEIAIVAKDDLVRDQIWFGMFEVLRSEVGGPDGIHITAGRAVVV